MYTVLPSKISDEVGRIDNFRALERQTYSIYLSTSDLSSFIISYSDKHEFSSIWKWISCYNDVMNHVACVIIRDVYPRNMHSCYKNTGGISFFLFLKNIRGKSKEIYIS